MTTRRAQLGALMDEIERELRRLELWETHSPAPHALRSEQPFCFDTLTFTQWLQWIFVARMRELLDGDAPLPQASDIHPLAEHVLAEHAYDSAPLLALIKRVDETLTS